MMRRDAIYWLAALLFCGAALGATGCFVPVASPPPAQGALGPPAQPPTSPNYRAPLPTGGLSSEATDIEKRLGYK